MAPPVSTQLDTWLARIGHGGLPILSETDRQIAALARRDGSTANELATVILRDPAMTSQVLRVANTVFYNPTRHRISTISRAVVVLGFNAIFTICVSKTVLDAFGGADAQQEALAAIARSLHAGVQARAFAELLRPSQLGDFEPEDVFIAALLFNLGEIAPWTHAPDKAREIIRQAGNGGIGDEASQRAVLGFTLAELTCALSRDWHLSPLLDQTLSPEHGRSTLGRLIRRANEVSEALARGQRERQLELAEQVAELLQQKPRDVRERIHASLEAARELVAGYGLDTAALEAVAAETNSPNQPVAVPDRQTVQLQILGEIAALLGERTEAGLLLEMVTEGIYRGVGLARVALLLLSKNRQQLVTKIALGQDADALRKDLQLSLASAPRLQELLQSGQPAWLRAGEGRDAVLARAVGEPACFLMPVGLPGHMIGLLYADQGNAPDAPPLGEADYQGFRLFGRQASLGLAYLDPR